jgi:hypothetical protein
MSPSETYCVIKERGGCMKNAERVLIKLAVIQFIFLLAAQSLLLYTDYGTYFSKMIQYEGVTKNNFSKIIETFDQ